MYCPLIALGCRSQQKYSMFTTGTMKGRKDNFTGCTFCRFCNWEREREKERQREKESATFPSALSCLTNWRDILGLRVYITEIWQHLESWNPGGLLESSRVGITSWMQTSIHLPGQPTCEWKPPGPSRPHLPSARCCETSLSAKWSTRAQLSSLQTPKPRNHELQPKHGCCLISKVCLSEMH